MKNSIMKESQEQLFEEGHRVIVAFLKEQKDALDIFIKGDRKQKFLLNHVINFGLNQAKEKREELKRKIGGVRSNISKTKNRLNKSLRQFCNSWQITPPIQLYFDSSALAKRIKHFGCCDNEGDIKAFLYVGLDKLSDMLDKAKIKISKEMHSVSQESEEILILDDKVLEVDENKKDQNLFRFEYRWHDVLRRHSQ